jgi:hypothetical protein
MPLKGGPARRRKRQKRLPTTAIGIRNARLAFMDKSGFPKAGELRKRWKGAVLHSYDVLPNGRTVKERIKILDKPIYQGRKGRCVYFVTESKGNPRHEDKPFESTSLCSGGRSWTGRSSWASKEQAASSAKRLAEGE